MMPLKLFFAAFASLLLMSSYAYAETLIPLPAAKPAPAFSFINDKGKESTLDASAYALTIVHFWATWCVPCIDELPELDAFARKHKPEEVHVLAISLDGAKMQRITDFYQTHGISTLTANHDPQMKAMRALGGKGLPYTVLINARGEMVASANGTVAWNEADISAYQRNSPTK